MQAVILAGGFGSRLSEETSLKPKPLVEIGGMPILWHIMKIYSYHGINDFVICLGYKGYLIKEYFYNYSLHSSNIEVDVTENSITYLNKTTEPWKIKLIDTGADSMTGGRLKRVEKYIDQETFCFTYGDGVADININDLVKYHKDHKKIATITVATPPGRFGVVKIEDKKVTSFEEKPKGDGGFVNGGFFILSPKVLELIDGQDCVWEQEPLTRLAEMGELKAFNHEGFWQPMDTLRDKILLEELWETGKAPWKQW